MKEKEEKNPYTTEELLEEINLKKIDVEQPKIKNWLMK